MDSSPRRMIVGLVICIVLALVVSGRPARAQTVAPALFLDYVCLQGGHTEFAFSVTDFAGNIAKRADYGEVVFSGRAGSELATAWPYLWMAHLVDSAGPTYITQVNLPAAATASVDAATLVMTTAAGPIVLHLANPQALQTVTDCSVPTSYVYSNCNNKLIRAYDGPNGYVYWGRPTALPAALPPGDWTANPLPYLGKAMLVALEGCRVAVRDSDGLLYLDFDGAGWSLPTLPYRTWLPQVRQ